MTNGLVGLLVAGRVTLQGSARALLTISVPVAAAAAAGLLVGDSWGASATLEPERRAFRVCLSARF